MRIVSLRYMSKRIRSSIKGTVVHRLLGEKLFGKSLWARDKRAIAGGLSLGLFVALTPTIPLQMLLAACGALYFHVNLPIALAACWITNPLTAPPFYYAAWRLGKFVLHEGFLIKDLVDLYSFNNRIGALLKQSAYLWTGSIILATLAALFAYVGVRACWTLIEKALRSRSSIGQKPHSADDAE